VKIEKAYSAYHLHTKSPPLQLRETLIFNWRTLMDYRKGEFDMDMTALNWETEQWDSLRIASILGTRSLLEDSLNFNANQHFADSLVVRVNQDFEDFRNAAEMLWQLNVYATINDKTNRLAPSKSNMWFIDIPKAMFAEAIARSSLNNYLIFRQYEKK
jgi:hypothetical protein